VRSSWRWRAARRLRVLRLVHSPGDLALLARIALVAAVAPALVRLKLSSLERLLEPRQAPADAGAGRAEKIVTFVDGALEAGRPLLRPGCLTRGVTAYYFLRRAGVDVSLRFGIGQMGKDLAGHCWLEKDGEPYMEPEESRGVFTAVHTMPSAGGGP